MSLKDEFKQELERIRADMRKLGSSIKTKAQKANAGIKNTWAEVEPKIAKFESEASVATDKAVAELKKSGGELLTQLTQIKDRLTKSESDEAAAGDDAGADAPETDAADASDSDNTSDTTDSDGSPPAGDDTDSKP